MPGVLEDRVLKSGFALPLHLRPFFMFRVSENPAAAVLGFYDENAKSGDQYVIDLSRPLFKLQGDVIEKVKIGSDKVES